ncbi:indole-3-glycerol phosphate synthase TrpC [Carnobacterium gallinarum]|uniref:indole-3-glycerol phosphate synthase TrpC n=1 Tax=Carnobacterium gallinarum TaxID=2749 RepID=UPI000552BB51|nr:indole-3-glycerol phosphate synthase TrpC [Carnobacterium gallinarum]
MTFFKKIIQQKQQEVAIMPLEIVQDQPQRPSFYDFLQKNQTTMQLIAEIKRASPSKGAIALDVDPLTQAKAYEEAGAGAISVLTDEVFFKGTIEDLREVAKIVTVPILCKDFIISEKQLIRAYNAGASIVLLIVAALTPTRLADLYRKAQAIGLEILVEVHNLAELKIAEKLGAKLIGINNRDLTTFKVAIEVSETLATHFQLEQQEICYISESGFQTATDIHRVAQNYQAVLVGEALMKDVNPTIAARNLMVPRC